MHMHNVNVPLNETEQKIMEGRTYCQTDEVQLLNLPCHRHHVLGHIAKPKSDGFIIQSAEIRVVFWFDVSVYYSLHESLEKRHRF